MVEVLSLMRSMASQLMEAEEWLAPLMQQTMYSQTRSFVAATLPSITQQANTSKVNAPLMLKLAACALTGCPLAFVLPRKGLPSWAPFWVDQIGDVLLRKWCP